LLGPAAGLSAVDARRGPIGEGVTIAVARSRYQCCLPEIAIFLGVDKRKRAASSQVVFYTKKTALENNHDRGAVGRV
jgi:hypothetical protein